jgi:hypothetical protein
MAKKTGSRQTARGQRQRTKARPSVAQPHDSSYKLLFSHPAMVADLLRGFVAEDWVAELDFTTLEKQSGSYISDDLRPRADDVVWRFAAGELAPMRNLAAALFQLENSPGPEELQQVVARLVEWLQAPEQASVRRAFAVWLRDVLLLARLPGGCS